jgi:hypothetical protein
LKTPTSEAVDSALARLGKPGAAAYFFDNLKNPEWIGPLYRRGFFKNPPAAERDTSDGSTSFPEWPELRYLLRMSTEVPEEVGKVVLAMPETDNARVRQVMVQMGMHLPQTVTKELGERAIRWLDDPFVRVHFDNSFPDLIAHLARVGEFNTATALATAFFRVEGESSHGKRRQGLDAWHVDHHLKRCIPTLQEVNALATLEFLRDRLCAATKEPSSAGEDYSYIWRQKIPESNYQVGEVKDVFVNWVRDIALSLAREASIGPTMVYELLLAKERPILTRITMYVAAEIANGDDPLVMQFLLDRSLVDRRTCRAEYRMLLQATYSKLSGENRLLVTQRLQSDFLESIPESVQKELDSERLGHYAKQIERDRLLAFGPLLPEPLQPVLARLLEEEGSPFEESGVVTKFGPTSPLTPDELRAMSVTDILQYISKGVPPDGLDGGGRVGLGQALHDVVKSRVNEFAERAEAWVGREAVYVRWIMMGFADVVAQQGRLDHWDPVLKLAKWVVSKPDAPVPKSNNPWADFDAGWVGARQSAALLLNNGMAYEESGLSLELRFQVWTILEVLLRDPDPQTPEVDESTIDSDSLSQSINTVRGWATHALFRYIWWVHKDAARPDVRPGLEQMPEVRDSLEATLLDPSPVIRSVLGDWLRTILYFHLDWAVEHLDQIFPESESDLSMWHAGWGTFVKYSPPYDPGFEALYRKYALGVARLKDASEENRKRMGELGLGNHLASYFWRAVGAGRSHELLLQYFDNASPVCAGHITGNLGRGLQDNSEALKDTTVSSLVAFWDELRAREEGWDEQKRREVVRQFGEWFPSERLPTLWAINSLQRCLSLGVGIGDLDDVLNRMTSLAAVHPGTVTECLALLLKGNRQLWHPVSWQREVEDLLEALLRTKDIEAREKALQIVNRLVESGSLFARDILARMKANVDTGNANSNSH